MSIKALIRAGREALKMTEQQFADAVGVSRAAVQQWERGTTAPKRNNQQAVADLLGISVGELMEGSALKYPTTETPPQRATEREAPHYDAGLLSEVRNLIERMSPEGKQEAINYLRYLALRHPLQPGTASSHGGGDPLSPQARAA